MSARVSIPPHHGALSPWLASATGHRGIERFIGFDHRLFELIRSGQLRSVKVGGLRRIPTSALADFVRRLEEEQAA